MERRLYQQQEFARRLIDSFPDLIFVLNAAGHYTFTSPRVKEILGYDPEEYDWSGSANARTCEDRPALQHFSPKCSTGRQLLRLARNARPPQKRRVAPRPLPSQPALRRNRQDRWRHHFRPRCHRSQAPRRAAHPGRKARRHGPDARRRCARAQQSPHRDSRRHRTAARARRLRRIHQAPARTDASPGPPRRAHRPEPARILASRLAAEKTARRQQPDRAHSSAPRTFASPQQHPGRVSAAAGALSRSSATPTSSSRCF